jgi:kinesin family protein 5
MADNIRVVSRFRPINSRELAESKGDVGSMIPFLWKETNSVEVRGGRNYQQGTQGEVFSFDRIFQPEGTTQEAVYEYVAKPVVEDVFKGYNGTIFAYGQTGTGKTYNMLGYSEDKGIIPRCCNHIFEHIDNDSSTTEYQIKCSYLEIYKEIVKDLLNPTPPSSKPGVNDPGLKVRETPARGVWVDGLTEHFISSPDEVLQLINLGQTCRATSSTAMNAESSRSHSLFIIQIIQKTADGKTKTGRLNLADLAGSEKVGKTGATGNTLEEAKKINQSLSSLANCIHSLATSSSSAKGGHHIPYRDSKLTHILKESLGGNSKTTLIITCSPHIFNLEETISTLRFGQRAKTIKNKAVVNQQRSVEELNNIIKKLLAEIAALKKHITTLEGRLGVPPGSTLPKGLYSLLSSLISSLLSSLFSLLSSLFSLLSSLFSLLSSSLLFSLLFCFYLLSLAIL